MIPDFKIKAKPPSDVLYTQRVRTDAHGRTVLEFVPSETMKKATTPIDRFIGIEKATAEVHTPQGVGDATMNLRFPIPANNINQAFEMFDALAQKTLDDQIQEIRRQELAAGGMMQLPGEGG